MSEENGSKLLGRIAGYHEGDRNLIVVELDRKYSFGINGEVVSTRGLSISRDYFPAGVKLKKGDRVRVKEKFVQDYILSKHDSKSASDLGEKVDDSFSGGIPELDLGVEPEGSTIVDLKDRLDVEEV